MAAVLLFCCFAFKNKMINYSHSSEKYLSIKILKPQPPRNVEVLLMRI